MINKDTRMFSTGVLDTWQVRFLIPARARQLQGFPHFTDEMELATGPREHQQGGIFKSR